MQNIIKKTKGPATQHRIVILDACIEVESGLVNKRYTKIRWGDFKEEKVTTFKHKPIKED